MQTDFSTRLHSALGAIHWRNVPVMIFLTIGGILMLMPFLWMVAASFKTPGEAYQLPPTLFPQAPTLDAYERLLSSDIPFLRMYWNSIVVASLSTLGVLVTSTTCGFALARLSFPGQRFVFGLILLGMMVPPALVLIPIYFGFAAVGLLDTLAALILPAICTSFGIYMVRQFMTQQPKELEEAALIDGAGYFTIFMRVSLPQLGPALAALGIITFTGSWNNFISPFVLVRSLDVMTLPLGIVALRGVYEEASLTVLMAAVSMSMVPLVVVFAVAQRFIIEGLTMTGIKG